MAKRKIEQLGRCKRTVPNWWQSGAKNVVLSTTSSVLRTLLSDNFWYYHGWLGGWWSAPRTIWFVFVRSLTIYIHYRH